MDDQIKCPNCGKTISGDRHYFYCVKVSSEGCNTLWGRDAYCYFSGLYIVDEVGGIVAYKQTAQEGGRVIKTDHLLPEYEKRGLHTL